MYPLPQIQLQNLELAPSKQLHVTKAQPLVRVVIACIVDFARHKIIILDAETEHLVFWIYSLEKEY